MTDRSATTTSNSRRCISRRALGAAVAVLGMAAAITLPTGVYAADEQTLVVNSDRSGAGQKAAMNKIAADFEAKNPGVKVTINYSDVESYKTSIRNFLVTNPPDVAFWFTGARMKTFTKRNLFDDMSGFFAENNLTNVMKPWLPAVSEGDKQYMMPTNFTTWGFFYNKQVFEKVGVAPPATWDELMAAAAKIKASGVTPFTIGTRDLWANALWFDYLDMRMNGLDFHMQLMDGKASYTDPRVKAVFAKWGEPIGKGYFLDNASSYGWQEAIPFLAQGKAAMYLLGPYVLTSLPAEAHGNIGFFPFPVIDPSVPKAEEISVNGVTIPSGAKNKPLARSFLAFLAQPDNLKAFALGGAVLPARTDVDITGDAFAQSQMALAKNAQGSAQFYDRDTDPEMAQVGMKGFQEFLANPKRSDTVLERLEAARQRIFK
ncbi:carbohydrate ABC transporter substrate-binding protein, CUT1 family [Azospirillum oryzae]|uniref:Carbohydrate ABC transporter substrate-binding protein, CUT1 family n=1 Tax=Azospirillum oryzae TaxID=286727 RepID=A0A1X7HMG4_9PROT|nr:ABC transporter substrate-binding protein [Azospirillum oryzae]SMF89414.1 carbohydrate ABC transporter substrate-binding protein, CUT1 family [Azospirillum oryzae]